MPSALLQKYGFGDIAHPGPNVLNCVPFHIPTRPTTLAEINTYYQDVKQERTVGIDKIEGVLKDSRASDYNRLTGERSSIWKT